MIDRLDLCRQLQVRFGDFPDLAGRTDIMSAIIDALDRCYRLGPGDNLTMCKVSVPAQDIQRVVSGITVDDCIYGAQEVIRHEKEGSPVKVFWKYFITVVFRYISGGRKGRGYKPKNTGGGTGQNKWCSVPNVSQGKNEERLKKDLAWLEQFAPSNMTKK